MSKRASTPAVRELLTPKQVARAIGVSEASLKRWCDKGLISAVRTAGGHRRLPLNGVIHYLRQSGQPLVRPEVLGLPPTTGTGETVQSASVQKLGAALEAGDEDQVRRLIFNLYLAGHTTCDLLDKIVAPAVHQIGEAWAHGDVEVYQERRGVETLLRTLYQLRQLLPTVSADAPYAIGGTPEGDPYALPTTMIEVVLREAGWRAESFGTNHPISTLCAAIRQRRPRLMWLSVSWVPSLADFLIAYPELYDTAVEHGTALVVGGRALIEQVRQQMSYSAYCDNLRHLVAFAATITPPPSVDQQPQPPG